MELNEFDLEILNSKGISQEKLAEELRMLADGFPYLRIEAPATPGHGISVLSPEMENQAESLWSQYLAAGGRVLKMVPASGDASRMLKDLFSFNKFLFFNKLITFLILCYFYFFITFICHSKKYFNYNIDVKPHLSVTWYSCNCQEKYCQSR